MADAIVVNSQFTASIFRQAFPSIQASLQVLYPAIHIDSYRRAVDDKDPSVEALQWYDNMAHFEKN
jgi:hypothetical protein